MKALNEMITGLVARLEKLARGNSVVAKPVSVGDCHVIPLCELRVGFGGGGGVGESDDKQGDSPVKGKGTGSGVGGGVSVSPLAVLVVNKGEISIKTLER